MDRSRALVLAILAIMLVSSSGCLLLDATKRDYNVMESMEIELKPEFEGDYYIVLPVMIEASGEPSMLFKGLKVKEGAGTVDVGVRWDGTVGANVTGKGDILLYHKTSRVYKSIEPSEKHLTFKWTYYEENGTKRAIRVQGSDFNATPDHGIKVSVTYKSESNYCIRNEHYGATVALDGSWASIEGAKDQSCA